MLRHRNDEPTGKLEYLRNDAAQTRVHDITTSEASVTLRYAPGESFVNPSSAVFRVAGRSYLHADSCHGASKACWAENTTSTARKQASGNVSGFPVGKDRL